MLMAGTRVISGVARIDAKGPDGEKLEHGAVSRYMADKPQEPALDLVESFDIELFPDFSAK